MAKYQVLTRKSATALGVIDGAGNSQSYTATAAQTEAAAIATGNVRDAVLATAVDLAPGEDLWLLDADGDSHFFAGTANEAQRQDDRQLMAASELQSDTAQRSGPWARRSRD